MCCSTYPQAFALPRSSRLRGRRWNVGSRAVGGGGGKGSAGGGPLGAAGDRVGDGRHANSGGSRSVGASSRVCQVDERVTRGVVLLATTEGRALWMMWKGVWGLLGAPIRGFFLIRFARVRLWYGFRVIGGVVKVLVCTKTPTPLPAPVRPTTRPLLPSEEQRRHGPKRDQPTLPHSRYPARWKVTLPTHRRRGQSSFRMQGASSCIQAKIIIPSPPARNRVSTNKGTSNRRFRTRTCQEVPTSSRERSTFRCLGIM